MELIKARIDRVIGTTGQDYAVVLTAETKSFLVFVGQPEVAAIYRELKGLAMQRPMAHDVIVNTLRGFDIDVRMIVISSIVESVFCATLLLRQGQNGEEGIATNDVRLDLRASDAMIVALKTGSQLWVSREILDSVEDVSALLPDDDDLSME